MNECERAILTAKTDYNTKCSVQRVSSKKQAQEGLQSRDERIFKTFKPKPKFDLNC